MGAIYSLAGETADVGLDAFSPVTDDYDPWDNGYTGTIREITIRLTGGEQETKSAEALIREGGRALVD
jgi:hypothetical protein